MVETPEPTLNQADSDEAPKSTQTQPSSVPKWEQKARDRIRSMLPKLVRPVEALLERDAVEADTRMLVTDLLCDVLGYDKYEDLTAEYQVKGDFADIGIRVDKQLKAFVEIKRVKQDLNRSHLRQVESYAMREGVVWAILTNARQWHLYRVEPVVGQQSELTLVLKIDLLDSSSTRERLDAFFLLSREAMLKNRLEEYWGGVQATSPKVLHQILLSDGVISQVSKELWRQTRQKPSKDHLTKVISEMLGVD